MSWFTRLFGRGSDAQVDPWAPRLDALTLDSVDDLIERLRPEPAPVREAILRRAWVIVGDDARLLLALARSGPTDAQALWTRLTEDVHHAAEAHDALADLASERRVAQAHRERAAAAAPGDMARLRRALGTRPARIPPRLPLGAWPPLVDRLPYGFTAREPIGQGPHGHVVRVVSDRIWAAKALRSDLSDHPEIGRVFDDLARVQALEAPGVATIVHLDRARGLWVRTHGTHTLGVRPVDLAPVREAVAALHEAGVAHGAIGPQNIVIDGTGGARLTDPGLCRLDGVVPSVAADERALAALMEIA